MRRKALYIPLMLHPLDSQLLQSGGYPFFTAGPERLPKEAFF